MMRSKRRYFQSYTSVVAKLVFFSLLWSMLTKGELSAWAFGAIIVPIAVWLNLRLFIPQKDSAAQKESTESITSFSFIRLLCLLPYFLMNSFKGGVQTSCLAFRRKAVTTSGIVYYSVRIPRGKVRLWFMHLISLLPGTLSACIEGDELAVHMLEVNAANIRDIQRCEEKIAFLFGFELHRGTLEE
ncbi:hypothetical protein EAG18_13465 [Pseudoalteromonas sp. J010]|uniref:Na+/H+ antiporter subunit E n=1 Tax=Pseudoalteromonas sp. J010 TaxID=998465 RepID=UPI000F64D27E|nr:Na+/H+ antiporter subunit E [Pseudoalteromonas sp. J010]RRS08181.1 hypothetical protein EAG18_13465 [Pseudoalteromonas sp. J010]